MPSEKITPPSGISDSTTSSCPSSSQPATSVACERLLTNGSRTAQTSLRSSQASCGRSSTSSPRKLGQAAGHVEHARQPAGRAGAGRDQHAAGRLRLALAAGFEAVAGRDVRRGPEEEVVERQQPLPVVQLASASVTGRCWCLPSSTRRTIVRACLRLERQAARRRSAADRD